MPATEDTREIRPRGREKHAPDPGVVEFAEARLLGLLAAVLAWRTGAGPLLRVVREGRRASQDEFAKSLGVTQTALSHWEGGVTPPDPDAVARVLLGFGVSESVLVAFKVAQKKAAKTPTGGKG
jgi:DNA-binding XRE family transcriptional regulator